MADADILYTESWPLLHLLILRLILFDVLLDLFLSCRSAFDPSWKWKISWQNFKNTSHFLCVKNGQQPQV
jgi:hypothetical protein